MLDRTLKSLVEVRACQVLKAEVEHVRLAYANGGDSISRKQLSSLSVMAFFAISYLGNENVWNIEWPQRS